MQNYFDNEIKQMEKEILHLKSNMLKTAGTIALARQTLNVQMVLESTGGIAPQKIVYIKINTNDTNQLFFVTLDKYYDDTLQPGQTEFGFYRERYYQLRKMGDSLYIRLVAIGTIEDQQTIDGGGTVNLPINMTVYSTDEFTLEEQ